ncbi:MAG: endonuclease V [Bacteroidota bacterium]
MIAAIDVHYKDDGSARAGAVVFNDFSDSEASRTYIKNILRVEDYVPGQFYRRELPCILAILDIIEEDIDTLIIDGYVDLGPKAGLGRYLWKALNGKIKIIGVAKKTFHGSDAIKVFRGASRQPLYITAAGMERTTAAGLIAGMHGKYRLPSLIRQADALSRYGKDA